MLGRYLRVDIADALLFMKSLDGLIGIDFAEIPASDFAVVSQLLTYVFKSLRATAHLIRPLDPVNFTSYDPSVVKRH